MQTATKGICVSRDQGATWSVVEGNKILGRCENGFCYSIAYPYDGRMALFSYDGIGGSSGGMSLDGAKTWKPFAQFQRGVELADVDWTTPAPNTIFGLTHEPFFSVFSSDAGASWQRLNKDETGGGPEVNYCVGIIGGTTLTRYNPSVEGGIIERSDDGGANLDPDGGFPRPGAAGRCIMVATSTGPRQRA